MSAKGLYQARAEALKASEEIVTRAEKENRNLHVAEQVLLEKNNEEITALNQRIAAAEAQPENSLTRMLQLEGPGFLIDAGRPAPAGMNPTGRVEHPKAAAVRHNFSAWMKRAVGNMTGLAGMDGGSIVSDDWRPEMEATAPSGIISVGAGTGLDSVNFAVPTQILPFMKSYFAFSPFEQAGASILSTDHMRNINLPIVAAGAPPSSYAEAAGPAAGTTGSQPFGLSGFTFGAHKKSRQVIASYESLMSTETPLQPMIVDELLAAMANVLTQDTTTAFNIAMTGASATLQVGSSGDDVYTKVTDLRHALVEGLEGPGCSFMLSRATLAKIRNTRASTSGVVMFDPEADTIVGRPYFVNESFDAVCGAGFLAYGNWNKGAWLRRTPILTRVLQELYWLNNEVGFLATAWADSHSLAELVSAPQPPTWQPLYYTVLS